MWLILIHHRGWRNVQIRAARYLRGEKQQQQQQQQRRSRVGNPAAAAAATSSASSTSSTSTTSTTTREAVIYLLAVSIPDGPAQQSETSHSDDARAECGHPRVLRDAIRQQSGAASPHGGVPPTRLHLHHLRARFLPARPPPAPPRRPLRLQRVHLRPMRLRHVA